MSFDALRTARYSKQVDFRRRGVASVLDEPAAEAISEIKPS